MGDAKKGVAIVVAGFVAILVGMFLLAPLMSATDVAYNAVNTTRYTNVTTILSNIPTIFSLGLMIAGIALLILGALEVRG